MSSFGYRKTAGCGRARLGRMVTAHGEVETPAFMPVGTQGAVKAVTSDELRKCGTGIVLSNTYHLFLRPGHEVIRHVRERDHGPAAGRCREQRHCEQDRQSERLPIHRFLPRDQA